MGSAVPAGKGQIRGAWTLRGGVGCVPDCGQRTRLQLACRAHIGLAALTDSEAASQSLPSGWVMGLFIISRLKAEPVGQQKLEFLCHPRRRQGKMDLEPREFRIKRLLSVCCNDQGSH